MDAVSIGKDNCCDLGKWIYGEGRASMRAQPAFTELLKRHKVFHVEAGKVARAINAGKYADASAMIAARSAFGAASASVAIAIGALEKAL